ncbi:hypothetical protein HGB07_09135, partial [Candidatus Roizmanbacteria bacterium]|nr:hypothetical protein [Candidatus Roizmanbacteria bacterium]
MSIETASHPGMLDAEVAQNAASQIEQFYVKHKLYYGTEEPKNGDSSWA